MRYLQTFLLLAAVLAAGLLWNRHAARPVRMPDPPAQSAAEAAPAARQPRIAPAPATGLPSFLPSEARDTLALIARGGPFPNRQDGTVFGNREGLLPQQPRGYYHEYTVATPGLGYRGARRIITGGNPPVVYYYTDDHYNSFRAFEVPR
ncbi:guanyl-specific ribonuclease Sa [Dyella sp. SG562]|uniref:ribonuclease domain-containing protein n=1 Tax=Dyella sp. SG562 TaxID=2587017 RepID=UPI0014236226|nr:ribonuclease domain-containing protein [Dyella sp. SG562]NII73787.1 guanyl-specific ribonuclease Sa [Dyella sp. SG562]